MYLYVVSIILNYKIYNKCIIKFKKNCKNNFFRFFSSETSDWLPNTNYLFLSSQISALQPQPQI